MKNRIFSNPEYLYYGDKQADHPYIGFELEVNPEKPNIELKYQFFLESFEPYNNKFWFKYDGSIGEYGVEIVSHPGTLNWHKNDGFIQDIFEKIHRCEMNHGINCGLHFHVDKNFFTQEEIASLDCFVNRPEVMKRLAHVGGRDLNSYCRCHHNKRTWGISDDRTALYIGRRTIEFRFCNSTSSIEEFFKRMELIYCLSHFSKVITIEEILNVSEENVFNKFLDFVKNMNLENLKVKDFSGFKNVIFQSVD